MRERALPRAPPDAHTRTQGPAKAPRERFACGAPARPWTRLHRRLLTADRIAYRIANDQCRDHLDLALPAC